MKKLNSDIIIKILILLCFATFYFRIIRDNQIMMYVNPRIIPFAIFGMISMFIVVLFLITDSFHNKKKKIKFKKYVIFILPLIMIFCMQSTSADSSIKTDDINTNLTSDNSKVDLSQDDDDKLYRKNNIIEVDSNNFLHSIDTLIDNADKYDGQEIEITGFVYNDKKLKDNEFIIGRFVMACCAADLQIEGIKCDSNNLETYDNDTWVKIKGKIKTENVNYAVEPVIVVEHIEKDSNPNTEYLYPF